MQNSIFRCLAIGLTLLVTRNIVAESPTRQAFDGERQVADAFLDQQRAECAVQQNRLESLQILRRNGGIAWKELAEQELAVSQLKRRVAAVERFLAFLKTLTDDLPQDSNVPTTYLALHSEHSARVMAWIRTDHASPALLAKVALDEHESKRDEISTDLSDEIQDAQAKLERARKTIAFAAEDEERFQKTATLQLHQARMTLQLLNAIQDQRHASSLPRELMHQTSTPSTSTDETRSSRVGTAFATASTLELSALTLRGLQLERELAAPASLELQRKFTCDRLRKLNELEKSRTFHLAETQSIEEELQWIAEQQKANNERASKLKTEAEALEKTVPAHWRTVVEEQLQLPPQSVAPPLIPERLRLRFEQLQTEIRLGDLRAEGDFLKEYLKRLSDVASVLPSAVPDLDWIQYRVRLNQSQCEETRQWLTWLAIEQRRLELQSALLTNQIVSLVQGTEQLEPLQGNGKEGLTTFPVVAGNKPVESINYLESPSIPPSELRWEPEPDCHWMELRESTLSKTSSPSRVKSPPRTITAGKIQPPPRLVREFRLNHAGRFQAWRTRDRNRQYKEEYSNGIRDPQYRRLPGYAPWYLPGSSTNFR